MIEAAELTPTELMRFVVWQSVSATEWHPIAMFCFEHDAKFFAKEFGELQPHVRFKVEHI